MRKTTQDINQHSYKGHLRNAENYLERLDWTAKLNQLPTSKYISVILHAIPFIQKHREKTHILLKANVFHCEPELVSNLI